MNLRPTLRSTRDALLMVSALLVLGEAVSANEPNGPTWRAGVASVVITPDAPMWMAGYASRIRPSEGKLHDLKAKALAVEDPSGNRAVLVTMDLVGISREVASAVCDRIASQHGLDRKSILLSVSHTHSGPVVGDNLRPVYQFDDANRRLVTEYTKVIIERLVEVASSALAKLAPADLAWGTGHATFAVNRRTNKEPAVPALREQGRLAGPVDHDVPVLSVRAKDGALRAVLFGYACHATVLSEYDWSGDYPGFAQIALEKDHPGVTALFFAGCGADQNPLPRKSVALAEHYGRTLADGVDAVLSAPMNPVGGALSAAYAEVPMAFATIPTREQLLEAAAGSNRYEVARAKMLLEQLDTNGSIRGDYPYPVQAWRLGDLTLVALGGEVVVDYSLRLKRELGPDSIWIAGYANDVLAYIPSLRVLKEGGYEGGGAMVYYGLPSSWASEIEEKIVATVHEQVKKVRESMPIDVPVSNAGPSD